MNTDEDKWVIILIGSGLLGGIIGGAKWAIIFMCIGALYLFYKKKK